jgi:hypothetical protein
MEDKSWEEEGWVESEEDTGKKPSQEAKEQSPPSNPSPNDSKDKKPQRYREIQPRTEFMSSADRGYQQSTYYSFSSRL